MTLKCCDFNTLMAISTDSNWSASSLSVLHSRNTQYTIGLSASVFRNVAMASRLVSCELSWLFAILLMISKSVIYIRRR